MNPWSPLLGDTVPHDIRGLPVRKHFLADKIDHSKLARPVAIIPKATGSKTRRPRPARPVNYWPLIGRATAAEIKAAADRAWGRI